MLGCCGAVVTGSSLVGVCCSACTGGVQRGVVAVGADRAGCELGCCGAFVTGSSLAAGHSSGCMHAQASEINESRHLHHTDI